MTIDAGLKPEGALERSPTAGAGAPSGGCEFRFNPAAHTDLMSAAVPI